MSTPNRNSDSHLDDPLFKWFLAFAMVVVLGFVAKETLHFSNAPSSSTKNEVKKEALPGGSRVWLNANSHFSYGTPWLIDIDRDIWIEGEAWFDLKKWGSREYVIHTPFADVIVKEAECNVFNRNKKLHIYNASGKLTLRSGPENKFREFTMEKGEYYEFDNGIVQKKELPAGEDFSWHDAIAK